MSDIHCALCWWCKLGLLVCTPVTGRASHKIFSDSRSKICTSLINGSIFRVKYAQAVLEVLALRASHVCTILFCIVVEVNAPIGEYLQNVQNAVQEKSHIYTISLCSQHWDVLTKHSMIYIWNIQSVHTAQYARNINREICKEVQSVHIVNIVHATLNKEICTKCAHCTHYARSIDREIYSSLIRGSVYPAAPAAYKTLLKYNRNTNLK